MVMPAPGAVCPAIVMWGWVITTSPRIMPEISKTTIRRPGLWQAALRLPGPEDFRFVTLITFPPRPPGVVAPNPSAPGNAAIRGCWLFLAGAVAACLSAPGADEKLSAISIRPAAILRTIFTISL
jgi:hypothetical protein